MLILLGYLLLFGAPTLIVYALGTRDFGVALGTLALASLLIVPVKAGIERMSANVGC